MDFLIGCDPEVFVRKDNLFQSAHGLIPGDKKNPFKVNKGAVQVDGMALEFNIDPAATSEEFCINVETVLSQMIQMVPGYEVVISPVAHFTPEVMKAQPPEALELGCDPDYNAWSLMPNIKPNADRPMRTASGHIHIGWTNGQDILDPFAVNQAASAGRQMDFFLGLPSLFYDADQERREMYGKGGCIRVKPYGVEYRTLSNAWLKNKKLMTWVFNNARKGMEALVGGNELANKYGNIEELINTGDKKEAMKILKKEKIEVCYG